MSVTPRRLPDPTVGSLIGAAITAIQIEFDAEVPEERQETYRAAADPDSELSSATDGWSIGPNAAADFRAGWMAGYRDALIGLQTELPVAILRRTVKVLPEVYVNDDH